MLKCQFILFSLRVVVVVGRENVFPFLLFDMFETKSLFLFACGKTHGLYSCVILLSYPIISNVIFERTIGSFTNHTSLYVVYLCSSSSFRVGEKSTTIEGTMQHLTIFARHKFPMLV